MNVSTLGKMTMKTNLTRNLATKPKHLVSINQLTKQELNSLVNKAAHYKKVFKNGIDTQANHTKLMGKLVGLLFSKRSTRTRLSCEGSAAYFGAQPIFLGKDDIQLGVNESVLDTTKVISSMTSCIFARVNTHQDILDLCQHSSVPIINSLCDKYHPLQAITDILTIKESFGKTDGLKLAWIGDSNNVINDLAIASLLSGINVSIAIPKGIELDQDIQEIATSIAEENNLDFEVFNDPVQALDGANIVTTDTWISMGEESQKEAKMKQFAGYQITQDMLTQGNVATNWKFLHCLPRHQEEVNDEIFYNQNSVVFEQAENRLYAAMAVIDAFVINKGDLLV